MEDTVALFSKRTAAARKREEDAASKRKARHSTADFGDRLGDDARRFHKTRTGDWGERLFGDKPPIVTQPLPSPTPSKERTYTSIVLKEPLTEYEAQILRLRMGSKGAYTFDIERSRLLLEGSEKEAKEVLSTIRKEDAIESIYEFTTLANLSRIPLKRHSLVP